MVVPSSRVRTSASLYPATLRASGVAMKRVPTQIPSAPRASAAASPRPSSAPGGHHRDVGSHRIDDLGHQRHGGHQAGVTSGLGALGDHDVAAGRLGPPGMVHLAAHVDHQETVAMAEVDHVGGHAQSGDEDGCTPLDDFVDLALQVPGHGREQVDAERLVGGVRTAAISATIRSVLMVEAPRQPKPPASDTAVTSGA